MFFLYKAVYHFDLRQCFFFTRQYTIWIQGSVFSSQGSIPKIYKVHNATIAAEKSYGSKDKYCFHCSVPGCALKINSRIDNRVKGEGKCPSCRKKTDCIACTEKPNHIIPIVRRLIYWPFYNPKKSTRHPHRPAEG